MHNISKIKYFIYGVSFPTL